MASVRLNLGTQTYVIPAKQTGFDSITITADLTDFTDTRSIITLEAFAIDAKGVSQSIAAMTTTGGVRPTVSLAGFPIPNPNILTFVTGSNREYKGDITVLLTVTGAAARISIPEIVTA